MAKVSYKIVRAGEEWAISRNGTADRSYVTQEAAFEVAAADASADLRSGFDVVIEAASPTDPCRGEFGGRRRAGTRRRFQLSVS